jgi:glycine oxidase
MTPDVIVVGGGVIGGAIAFRLAGQGIRVVGYDRSDPGQASSAAAGMLAPLSESARRGPFLQLGLESLRLYPALIAELLEQTGIDVGFRHSGLVRLALSQEQVEGLRDRKAWQEATGLQVSWLSRDRVVELEPLVTPSVQAALYYPTEYQVSAPVLTNALWRAATNLGAELRRAPVDRLLIEGDRVLGVGSGPDELRADEVVLAAGAWTSEWSSPLRTSLPVVPVRGQIVSFDGRSLPLGHILFSSGGYVVAKANGTVLAGTTEEEGIFEPRPTAAAVQMITEIALELVPRLQGASFAGAWAGLRPATPDRLPIIGRPPGWRGIVLATGHFRNGILLAPVTAHVIVDLLTGRSPRLEIDAFDPSRFLVRAA